MKDVRLKLKEFMENEAHPCSMDKLMVHGLGLMAHDQIWFKKTFRIIVKQR